jgi:hypothetical protein
MFSEVSAVDVHIEVAVSNNKNMHISNFSKYPVHFPPSVDPVHVHILLVESENKQYL